jgi:hypothetical protein
VFGGEDETRSATTRDINLEDGLSGQSYIFSEDFESKDNLDGYAVCHYNLVSKMFPVQFGQILTYK